MISLFLLVAGATPSGAMQQARCAFVLEVVGRIGTKDFGTPARRADAAWGAGYYYGVITATHEPAMAKALFSDTQKELEDISDVKLTAEARVCLTKMETELRKVRN